jgi:protein SCO1/2
MRSICVQLWLVLLLAATSAFAQQAGPPGPSSPLYGARPETGNPSSGLPKALSDVGLEQKLDQQLPLDLVFRDESGQEVKLGQYFGQKPVILALV